MRAPDLLALAIDWLADRYPDSLIVPELSIGTWGAALIDVAAITPTEIIGVEIKGEGDSPTRLPLQAAIYSKAATRMFFLPCPALEDRCFKHIPDAWGKLRVADGRIEQKLPEWRVGEGRIEPEALCTAPLQLLQAMWRQDLDTIARLHGVITGKVDVETLRRAIAEEVPLRTIRREVCEALRRRNWNTDRGWKRTIWARERLAA